jgi:hypothetical protein
MVRRLACVRFSEHSLALRDQFSLPRSETGVQRKKKINKAGRKIALEVEV